MRSHGEAPGVEGIWRFDGAVDTKYTTWSAVLL